MKSAYNPAAMNRTLRVWTRTRPLLACPSDEVDPMNTLSARRSLLVGACVAALAVSSSVVRAQETPLAWAGGMESSNHFMWTLTHRARSDWDAGVDLIVART